MSLIYPKADTSRQWFANTYPAARMPYMRGGVLHTTEGSNWPGYAGGSMAPTFTVWPRHGVRQHFPVNMPGRALKHTNPAVPTNTAGVVQIECVGTCTRGGPGLYWPSASDEDMVELADLLRWLHSEHGIPLVATARPWLPYPKSYGGSAARMTTSEWQQHRGWCGHQHVPQNVHGDPGDFPIARLLALADPTPAPPLEDDVANIESISDEAAKKIGEAFAVAFHNQIIGHGPDTFGQALEAVKVAADKANGKP